ncbi:MAG: hypothetical protein NE327_05885, partial [Lentisphaeraceae bacterium]|nr:hypothetical protein [Lentisphaeraceae bacterium]
ITGTSFVRELLGKKDQKKKSLLYWEYGNQQAVRAGDWKLYRSHNRKNKTVSTSLYNLQEDISEQNDLSEKYPEKITQLLKLIKENRTESKYFPSIWDKN